jgi:hypothetical protein
MSLINSRNKLVTFRLSLEEFESLRSFCISKGARSVSEFARDAILHQINGSGAQRTFVSGDLVTLSSALEDIDIALKNLSGRISKILGSSDKFDK